MSNFKIHTDPEMVDWKHTPAFGSLFVQVNNILFPDRSWTDFVVVVLGHWRHELSISGSGCENVKLQFMDGPYYVQFLKRDKLGIYRRCVMCNYGGKIMHETDCDISGSIISKEIDMVLNTLSKYQP
jgi:hypothetical protein